MTTKHQLHLLPSIRQSYINAEVYWKSLHSTLVGFDLHTLPSIPYSSSDYNQPNMIMLNDNALQRAKKIKSWLPNIEGKRGYVIFECPTGIPKFVSTKSLIEKLATEKSQEIKSLPISQIEKEDCIAYLIEVMRNATSLAVLDTSYDTQLLTSEVNAPSKKLTYVGDYSRDQAKDMGSIVECQDIHAKIVQIREKYAQDIDLSIDPNRLKNSWSNINFIEDKLKTNLGFWSNISKDILQQKEVYLTVLNCMINKCAPSVSTEYYNKNLQIDPSIWGVWSDMGQFDEFMKYIISGLQPWIESQLNFIGPVSNQANLYKLTLISKALSNSKPPKVSSPNSNYYRGDLGSYCSELISKCCASAQHIKTIVYQQSIRSDSRVLTCADELLKLLPSSVMMDKSIIDLYLDSPNLRTFQRSSRDSRDENSALNIYCSLGFNYPKNEVFPKPSGVFDALSYIRDKIIYTTNEEETEKLTWSNQRCIQQPLATLKDIEVIDLLEKNPLIISYALTPDKVEKFKENFLKNNKNKDFTKLFDKIKEVIFSDQEFPKSFRPRLINFLSYLGHQNTDDLWEIFFSAYDWKVSISKESANYPGNLYILNSPQNTIRSIKASSSFSLMCIPQATLANKDVLAALPLSMLKQDSWSSMDNQPTIRHLNKALDSFCVEEQQEIIKSNYNLYLLSSTLRGQEDLLIGYIKFKLPSAEVVHLNEKEKLVFRDYSFCTKALKNLGLSFLTSYSHVIPKNAWYKKEFLLAFCDHFDLLSADSSSGTKLKELLANAPREVSSFFEALEVKPSSARITIEQQLLNTTTALLPQKSESTADTAIKKDKKFKI